MADWTPRVRRINTGDVGEQGKLAFISSLIGEQRFDEAEEELKSLLEANPRSYLANLHMGRLLQRKREFDRAVEHFETARVANPANTQAALLAGTAYLRLDEIERAGDAFHAALAIDPKLATAHAGVAQVHFRRNELAEAEARLQQALAYDPQLQQARALLARIHGRQGDTDASKREIEELVSSRPDQPKPVVALARVHLQRNEPKEAIAVLEPAAARHEDSVELWAMLARARLAAKDYAGAEEALRSALALDPKQRMLGILLLQALIPQGKLQDAMQMLERVPDRARSSPRFHAVYGDVHMAGGHYRQASESYRAALLHRADGESVVAAIEGTAPKGGEPDWKVIAESYQAKLQEMRKANDDEDEDDRAMQRRPRGMRRRQGMRGARA
jgi:tetratricopeptide (TPR) repeat protein